MKSTFFQLFIITISLLIIASLVNIYIKIYTDNDTKYIKDTTVKTLQNQITSLNNTNTQGFSLSFRGRNVQAIVSVQGGNSFNGYIFDNDTAEVNITTIFPQNITKDINNTNILFYNLQVVPIFDICCSYTYISSDFKNICIFFNYSEPYYGCSELVESCSLISGTVVKIEGIAPNNIVLLYRNFITNC